MTIVADTSPLNYLVMIGQADILRELYGRVLIPPAVASELAHRGAPQAVAAWIEQRPAWVEVRRAAVHREPGNEELDVGESEALALAEEYKPDVLLLVDEEAARLEAQRRHIRTTGTLGVLADAAARGLLDLAAAIERLRSTNFRAADSLLEWFIARDRQRKEKE